MKILNYKYILLWIGILPTFGMMDSADKKKENNNPPMEGIVEAEAARAGVAGYEVKINPLEIALRAQEHSLRQLGEKIIAVDAGILELHSRTSRLEGAMAYVLRELDVSKHALIAAQQREAALLHMITELRVGMAGVASSTQVMMGMAAMRSAMPAPTPMVTFSVTGASASSDGGMEPLALPAPAGSGAALMSYAGGVAASPMIAPTGGAGVSGSRGGLQVKFSIGGGVSEHNPLS
jgi:hypothetical protein